MITVCWAAKGGSGTTVVAATRALTSPDPTLLVDLAGDLPTVLGLADPDGPGIHDWLESSATGTQLRALETPIDDRSALLPAGRPGPTDSNRWADLADELRNEPRDVIVDAGSTVPRTELLTIADHRWIVTRACYLGLRSAVRQGCRPTGVVLVDEPGHAFGVEDVEATLGAPVVATLLLDPAVARAVDAGLLAARLPARFRHRVASAA